MRDDTNNGCVGASGNAKFINIFELPPRYVTIIPCAGQCSRIGHFRVPSTSVLKPFLENLSYENEFYSHYLHIIFRMQIKLRTWTRFETEARKRHNADTNTYARISGDKKLLHRFRCSLAIITAVKREYRVGPLDSFRACNWYKYLF